MEDLYNGVLLVLKDYIIQIEVKWMLLEKFIFCKITQIQKDKYNMYSLISEYQSLNK